MLIVKRPEDVRSILLTESTGSNERVRAGVVYSYWTAEYHTTNGDEKRLLNGEMLAVDSPRRYYLVDSTPEPDDEFGEVFIIRIPRTLHYGFSSTREGTVSLTDSEGVYINIRTFTQPFADYRGGYRDNPFILTAVAEKAESR